MRVSTNTLVKIAAIGGIITGGVGYRLRSTIDYNIKQTVYYKDAMCTLRTNRGAVYLLGEPIKAGKIDIDNTNVNFTKENVAQYKIPIRAPKQNGTVYFWARLHDGAWIVNRIELELENEPDRRLLVKNID